MKTIKDLDQDGAMFYVLSEMFKKVSADPDDIDISEDYWCFTYSWTELQQKEFSKWMVKELSKKRWLWKGLTGNKPFTLANKANRVKLTEEFIFLYGWKTYQNKEAEA